MDEHDIELMCSWALKRIRGYGPEYVVRFVDCEQSALIIYQDSLGREIRNQFKLWHQHWTPDIKNGVDCSPQHPDQISMRVIYKLWNNLQ